MGKRRREFQSNRSSIPLLQSSSFVFSYAFERVQFRSTEQHQEKDEESLA
jgi:hypothetical protein